jgi:antitoxin VapB
MTIHVRDSETDGLVRELALRKRGVGLTQAVKLAVSAELRQDDLPMRERLGQLQAKVVARASTGLKADKAYFDDLSGE